MGSAHKDKKNPFFRSTYADLTSVWDACRQPLADYGLSVVQTMGPCEPGSVCVVTTLLHSSGEWIKGSLTSKPTKSDPQGMGSAITYARRYALAAMVGVCPSDDDGNAASRSVPKPVEIPPAWDEVGNFEPVEDDGPPAFEKICTFGKNSGTAWKNMSTKQLQWYAKTLTSSIEDPTKKNFKAKNEAALRGVNEALLGGQNNE